MSFLITVTTTRPDGVLWYSAIEPVQFREFNAWCMSQPGVVSLKQKLSSDPNVVVHEMTFVDRDSWKTYTDACWQNQFWLQRREYNIANGISMDLTMQEI